MSCVTSPYELNTWAFVTGHSCLWTLPENKLNFKKKSPPGNPQKNEWTPVLMNIFFFMSQVIACSEHLSQWTLRVTCHNPWTVGRNSTVLTKAHAAFTGPPQWFDFFIYIPCAPRMIPSCSEPSITCSGPPRSLLWWLRSGEYWWKLKLRAWSRMRW